MTVDTNYNDPYEIVFASNHAVTPSGASCLGCLWNFDLNTSDVFAINWFRRVPKDLQGYGNLQGVAMLSPGRVLVQHDWDPEEGQDEDHLRLLDTSTNPIGVIDYTFQAGTDLWGVVAAKAGQTSACDYWLAFSTRATGPTPSVLANACATLFAVEVSACD